jgi:hypothetical protein
MSRPQAVTDEEPRRWASCVAMWWSAVWDDLRDRWATLRREPEAGYSTEAVLVTALLVAAALVVISIIVAKVTEKANQIDLGFVVGQGLVVGQSLVLGLG